MEVPVCSIDVRRLDGLAVVAVRGELDLETTPQVQQLLGDLIEGQGNVSLALDVRQLTFIDSTGLGALILAHKALCRPPLKLIGPTPHIRRLLDACGLTEIFEISDDVPGSGSELSLPASRLG